MGIDQDDFRNHVANDERLRGVLMSKPDQVFCELGLALDAGARLSSAEGMEASLHHALDDLNRRDIGILGGHLGVGPHRESGRRSLRDLVDGERSLWAVREAVHFVFPFLPPWRA